MSRNTASCLVGLIVIETLSHEPCRLAALPDGQDTTLAGLLAYLATGGRAAAGVGDDRTTLPAIPRVRVPRPFAARLGSTTAAPWPAPARLSADVSGLATQLEGAWRQTRRKISCARRAAV